MPRLLLRRPASWEATWEQGSIFIWPASAPLSDGIGASQEADQTLALLNLLLDLVAGRGDLCLSWEHGTDEREHGAPHGGVEGPAHGAEPGPVRGSVLAAVQLNFVGTPASGVQHQTQNQEQTCEKANRSVVNLRAAPREQCGCCTRKYDNTWSQAEFLSAFLMASSFPKKSKCNLQLRYTDLRVCSLAFQVNGKWHEFVHNDWHRWSRGSNPSVTVKAPVTSATATPVKLSFTF